LTDSLERTFQELRGLLGNESGISAPTHTDPFFTFIHETHETLELHRCLRRWGPILERDGLQVEIHSLRKLVWDAVEASDRWDDWLEAEEPGHYAAANTSMRDVLIRDKSASASAVLRAGILPRLGELLSRGDRRRLVLLTDTALLHPWFRPDKISNSLHDQILCSTVLFYPGHRRGPKGLHFLDFHAEDSGGYRSTILGGL
jgi:hypothetical protein